jgi:hypothetical protein
LECARNSSHDIKIYLSFSFDNRVQKIGQFPSFADIANDESEQYRSVLTKEDSDELHKAIGLAAHGVGIGSYVYLRRIFERLIWVRFDEFKDAESWKDDDFRMLRMAEKVSFLKGHLPDFLVENSRIYSILSMGVHSLDEETCLSFFEPLRQSIIMILEDDKRKQEELKGKKEKLARRDALRQAISQFKPPEITEEEET